MSEEAEVCGVWQAAEAAEVAEAAEAAKVLQGADVEGPAPAASPAVFAGACPEGHRLVAAAVGAEDELQCDECGRV